MGFRVWDLGFGILGLGFRVWDFGFGILGLGFRVWGFGALGLEFRGCINEDIQEYLGVYLYVRVDKGGMFGGILQALVVWQENSPPPET